VLDIPCGGGFALRVLRPGQPVRYVAADISPHMLGRAREVARGMRAPDAIEFVEADVTALQFDDASFDLCVTYNGLHCLPDPRAALAELTRAAGWDAAGDVMCYGSRSAQGCPDRNVASRRGV
jgi:ubiquinone/menaquinone biosynthesis C-methylase UbiE